MVQILKAPCSIFWALEPGFDVEQLCIANLSKHRGFGQEAFQHVFNPPKLVND